MAKARKAKNPINLAFVDLEKAYDRVDRKALYETLNELGFGGETLKLIQHMYKNDSLQISVNGELTKQLFLTQGLRQGKV